MKRVNLSPILQNAAASRVNRQNPILNAAAALIKEADDLKNSKEKYFNSLNSSFSLHILKNYAEQGFKEHHFIGIENIDSIEKAIAIGELEQNNIPHRTAAELASQLSNTQARYIYTKMPRSQKSSIYWIEHLIKYDIDPLSRVAQPNSPEKSALVPESEIDYRMSQEAHHLLPPTRNPLKLKIVTRPATSSQTFFSLSQHYPAIDRQQLLSNFNEEYRSFFKEYRHFYCAVWKDFYNEYRNYLLTTDISNLETESYGISSIDELVFDPPLSFNEDLNTYPNLDSRAKIAEECRRRHLGKLGINLLKHEEIFHIFKDVNIIGLENLSILKRHLFTRISYLSNYNGLDVKLAAEYINKLSRAQTLILIYSGIDYSSYDCGYYSETEDDSDCDSSSNTSEDKSRKLKKDLTNCILENIQLVNAASLLPITIENNIEQILEELKENYYRSINSEFSLLLLKAGVSDEYLIDKSDINSQEKVDAILEKIRNGKKAHRAIKEVLGLRKPEQTPPPIIKAAAALPSHAAQKDEKIKKPLSRRAATC